MSTFERVEQENQPLLVNGYIRQYYKYSIPNDISTLILWFYTTSTKVTWTITNEELCKMEQSVSSIKLQGPSFVFYGIEFESVFGQFSSYQIHIKSLPINLAQTRIKIILKCKQVNIEWRKMITLSPSIFAWNSNTTIAWNRGTLSMNESMKYDKLTFECFVDLLSIIYDYKHNGYHQNQSSFIRPIKINPYYEDIKFEWELKDEKLQKFKKNTVGMYLYSDYFGVADNFCLSLHIAKKNNVYQCWLGVHALSLPYYITDIKMKYEIEIFGDDIDFYAKFPVWGQSTFTIGDECFHKRIMDLSDLLPLETLDINVILQRQL